MTLSCVLLLSNRCSLELLNDQRNEGDPPFNDLMQTSVFSNPNMAAGDVDASHDGAGPGVAYMNHVIMEDLLDKLKLLNYEQELLRKSTSYKAVSRHYFAVPTNPGEQFFMFTAVAAWLIQKAGDKSFEFPQEHDDPNATISRILDQLRKLEVSVDFPPNKLKSGAGEQCIFVLDCLANAALKDTQFSWEKPAPVQEEQEEGPTGADESEVTAEQFEEEDEEPELGDDDDEGGFLDLDGLRNLSNKQLTDADEKQEILQSDTDAAAWKLEVERVLPSLKITIRQDAKDWRSHLEQMQQYRSSIGETLQSAKSLLDRLATDIGKNMEKISSREKYLNSQLESLLSQFRSVQDRTAETREKYREASGGVTERSRTLAQITDDLEQIKQEMDERGLSLTDGAPLVKVKQAISRLQQELVGMDIEMGVIEQFLMQAQLRDRANLQQDMLAAHGPPDYVY